MVEVFKKSGLFILLRGNVLGIIEVLKELWKLAQKMDQLHLDRKGRAGAGADLSHFSCEGGERWWEGSEEIVKEEHEIHQPIVDHHRHLA